MWEMKLSGERLWSHMTKILLMRTSIPPLGVLTAVKGCEAEITYDQCKQSMLLPFLGCVDSWRPTSDRIQRPEQVQL